MSALTPPPRVALAPLSARRRATDRVMRAGLLGLTLIALLPLVLILVDLIRKGTASLNGTFFSRDPTGSYFGSVGGARSAVLGSVEIVAIATAIAIPLGLGAALYLSEYGRASRLGTAVRYGIDVLAGLPSIVLGLCVYATLVLTRTGADFAGWKGSVAIALLMLPLIARSCDVALGRVPAGLREAALALGWPRRRVIVGVVLPAALPGLVSGCLLAVARGIGETAPLLFTAASQNGLTVNPASAMNSLPLQTFDDITSTLPGLKTQAWTCGLVLMLMVLILVLAARGVARRSPV